MRTDARALTGWTVGALLLLAAVAASLSDVSQQGGTSCPALVTGAGTDPLCAAENASRWTLVVVLAALGAAAVVVGLVVPRRRTPSLFEAPLRYGVVAWALLTPAVFVLLEVVGPPRPGEGENGLETGWLPLRLAVAVLVGCLVAAVGRRPSAWAHLLAAAAVGAPLVGALEVLRIAVPGPAGGWSHVVLTRPSYGDDHRELVAVVLVAVTALVLTVAVRLDRRGRAAPPSGVSLAVLLAGVAAATAIRVPALSESPRGLSAAVWLPVLTAPVVIGVVTWAIAACRTHEERPTADTRGSRGASIVLP